MKQLISGYILDNILNVFDRESFEYESLKKLSFWLSYFQINTRTGFEEKETEYKPVIATLINMLQRGLPTKMNMYALKEIVANTSFFEFDKNNNISINVLSRNIDENIENLIFRSFHIIDPRITKEDLKDSYQKSWEELGSEYEENFIFHSLPDALNHLTGRDSDFICQLLATQRQISNIIENSDLSGPNEQELNNNFVEQQTDFSIEFPYHEVNKPQGMVLEIDGSQHKETRQDYLDRERDKAVVNCKWHNTLRIRTEEFETSHFLTKINKNFLSIINNRYAKTCQDNYINPLFNDETSREILELSLMPFAIARIQRVFLEAVNHGRIPLEKDNCKIAVIERDVPCAKIAIDDLITTIEKLNGVLNKEYQLAIPKIELNVFSTAEFIYSKFQTDDVKPISELSNKQFYDLAIDISILERSQNPQLLIINAEEIITIRSVHYLEYKRKIITNGLIKYNSFCKKLRNEEWEINNVAKQNLEYFLQSIFRKVAFRDGQLPIMNNALQRKSVIGLLPTGGGKSLTYQLSAMLQPGICLVIDPIRSLMKDQVDGLLRNDIDSCLYINSSIQGEEKRKAMSKFANGEVHFVFISPERMQMEEFRDLLHNMYENEIYFSYCIIDEAHCVSEWGHDFRTAYLRLGENAIQYCKTKNLKYIPLFGLTATASFDVLSDVQRELSGNHEEMRLREDAIVRSEYTKRHELQFLVKECNIEGESFSNIWGIRDKLGNAKQDMLIKQINEIPYDIEEYLKNPDDIFIQSDLDIPEKKQERIIAKQRLQIEDYDPDNFYKLNTNAGLIFCPHKSGNYGITDRFKDNQYYSNRGVLDRIAKMDFVDAGFFMGSGDNENKNSKVITEESFKNQDDFINNKTNLMIATKAFGMGIDKENIRYTIHINYPPSIESYVQEAGRAGRDGKIALSYILFNDQEFFVEEEKDDVNHDLDVNKFFHRNSFKGIEKEMSVIDELLTTIHYPDRTFELVNLIESELDIEVDCSYWKKGEGFGLHRLYIEKPKREGKLGFIDLDKLIGIPKDSIDSNISSSIFKLLIDYIKSQNIREPIHEWINRSEKRKGIGQILGEKSVNEKFEIVIGFYNDVSYRIEMLTKWIQKVVHSNFSKKDIYTLRKNSPNAEKFIEELRKKYSKFTNGEDLDFDEICSNRDQNRGFKSGHAINGFKNLYNGYRDKADTEKAIYRLSTLSIIDDYTVNFSGKTFTLIGTKKKDEDYKKYLRDYLLKYYSDKSADAKLRKLEYINESEPLKKYLRFLIEFTYNEIQKKRERAIEDMQNACQGALEPDRKPTWLKEYIDLYFNSKYARKDYEYEDNKGNLKNGSLYRDTTDKETERPKDDINIVWKYLQVVDEDTSGSQIDNIKHLRGATLRILRTRPDNYTMLLLNAFSLYMLEYRNKRYLEEAENLLINAFFSMQDKEPNWDEDNLREIYNKYTDTIKSKNEELIVFMDKYGFEFNFDNVLIKKILEQIKYTNASMDAINEKLFN